MLAKGNVWYVRHYEAYFDRVQVAYLLGGPIGSRAQGGTTLVALGSGRQIVDLLLSPWRLFRFARRVRPSAYLTADQVFGWWTSLLVRMLLRARVRLMPVCQPEVIYAATGRALSSLPIPIERLFVRLSFASADRVLTARAFGSFVEWLRGDASAARKLIVVDTIAEALPGMGFLEEVRRRAAHADPAGAVGTEVIYVGRLSSEKLVDDLLKMVATLAHTGGLPPGTRLRLIGDGPERPRLEALARELGIVDHVEFVGVIPNEDLPQHLLRARAFVSTLTGTSLREAALCGLPVVAYDIDWLSGLLVHEQNALLVPHRDFVALGRELRRLLGDAALRRRLSENIRGLARQLWSTESVASSLAMAFPDP
jgi:glycosyltransferase involved in cell wall biosynthesis